MDQPRYPQSASRSGPLLATPVGVDDASAFSPRGAHTSGRLRLVSPKRRLRRRHDSLGTNPDRPRRAADAGLGYLIGPLGVLFFFAEKRNRFLRFHCSQVILLAIVSVVLGTLWSGVITLESLTSGATNPRRSRSRWASRPAPSGWRISRSSARGSGA